MNDFPWNYAPPLSNITLLFYVLIILPLILGGFYAARRRLYVPHHKWIMTSVVALNWFFIVAVMLASYQANVRPGVESGSQSIRILLPLAHLITGGIAQIIATYLVVLMWTENTRFERLALYRTQNIKILMRVTLGLWLAAILLGVATYFIWYTPPASIADDDVAPLATEEPEIIVTPAATEDASAPLTTEIPSPAVTEEADDDSGRGRGRGRGRGHGGDDGD